ncbi:hypothetical protein [Mesorhizobium sp. BH1-1-4]|uniref:hypothetical protein n=1 Tax=Mesorhizobium sp. BH1-1-4 TaxID=2876662 RepID=UPI001CD084AB|nr:hypothetical protein [Mesorhizobium sp. BH1-1-4]MBZ9998123.1 hypothetical protein [Mesorhizobium sp. BH1-1-4]
MTPNELLEYQTHFEGYQSFLTGDAEKDACWHFEAQETHAICVLSAIQGVQLEIIELSAIIKNEDAYYNLNFGAARRSRMISGAFRQLHYLIAPNRSEPMLHDDVFEAARALNDIYIHTRGFLDNYAWALVHLFGDEASKALHRGEVDLFGKKFLSTSSFSEFKDVLAPFANWNLELKERRDPVAHRIPLSVPPSFLNDTDQAEFSEVNKRFEAARKLLSEVTQNGETPPEADAAAAEADKLYERLQKIGRFAPIIVHDPKEGGTRIYPTVPHDIGRLVRISRELNHRISRRLGS